jgi:hypothetical protein
VKIKPDMILRGVFAVALAATPVAAAGIGDERALLFHVDQDQAGMGVIDLPTLIDYPLALVNVTRWAQSAGHEVVETRDLGPSEWALVLRRKKT